MKLRACMQKLFKYFDLFSITQFLRYKQEQEYKTVSGGIVSLLIVSIFLALFFNTALQTINKSIINWSSENTFISQPPPTILTFSNTSFMFTVGVMGLDLNDPTQRYFDIKMAAIHNGVEGSVISQQNITLVPCTPQHFGITQQLRDSYYQTPANKWLCPPLNFSYQIQGKFISKNMQYIQVSINQCNNSIDPSRPCVAQATIDSMILNYGPFMASFFYINPMINPGQSDYLNYYMQSKNFVSFTKSLGAYGIGYVEDYAIVTDQSVLPFTQDEIQTGVTVPDLFQTVPYQITSPKYASFNLMKSSLQTLYNRSFNKVDQFFSYVGGLVGSILGLMLFMGNFTSMAFELDLSQKLFRYSENEQTNFKRFHLLHYLSYVLYQVGSFFNCFKGWAEMKKKQKCVNQVQKQLDISLILRRINFLQKSISVLLGSEKFVIYHEQKRQILAEVKARRRLYFKKKRSQSRNETIQNIEEQQSSSNQDSEEQDQQIIKNSKVINEDSFIVNGDFYQSTFQKDMHNKNRSSQSTLKDQRNKIMQHNNHQINVTQNCLNLNTTEHEQTLVQFFQLRNKIQTQNNMQTMGKQIAFQKEEHWIA